jgi:3-hydroxyisobutyrate dehydrogenase
MSTTLSMPTDRAGDRGEKLARVAFVGLGAMGTPMSRRLLEAGFRVTGYDTSRSAAEDLVSVGGSLAVDLSEVARTPVIILMLPTSDVVETVVRCTAFWDCLAAGTVVVDMGSSEPMRTRALAQQLQSIDVTLIDAPVSGGVSGAIAGTLAVMAGGDSETISHILPLLRTFGNVHNVGPSGAGHALKALNNLLSATHLLAASEVMTIGAKFDLDPTTMLEVINSSSGRCASTEKKWPDFVLPGTYNSGFKLALMVKDMRVALGLADSLGMSASLSADALAVWERAASALRGDADHTEIARWVTATS